MNSRETAADRLVLGARFLLDFDAQHTWAAQQSHHFAALARDLHAASDLGVGMLRVQRDLEDVRPLIDEIIGTLPDIGVHNVDTQGIDTVGLYISAIAEQCPLNSPAHRVVSSMLEAAAHARKGKAANEGFGRLGDVTEIYKLLVGPEQDNAVILLGERRIGKSTLLNLLCKDARFTERYSHFVVLDLQYFAGKSTADETSDKLFERIRRELNSELGLSLIGRGDDPFQKFDDFMQSVDRALASQSKRALLVFDEVEKIYSLIEQGAIEPEAIASLRAVTLRCKQISFIYSGEKRVLQRHIERPQGRLFQLGLPYEIGPLEENAAKELIEEPARDLYDVVPEVRDELLADTGRQPYLLQLLCRAIFQHMQENALTRCTVPDLEALLSGKILPDESFFAYLVSPWSKVDGDSDILDALAAVDPQQRRRVEGPDSARRFVTIEQLHRELQRRHGDRTPSFEQLSARLQDHWRDHPSTLERSEDHRDRYRIRVGLLTRHLRRPRHDLLQDWILG